MIPNNGLTDSTHHELTAKCAAELSARESYGRLLALIASRTRDLAVAEDALQDAFAAALVDWPRAGVPANPDAWLLVAARRKLIDAQRRSRTAATHALEAGRVEVVGLSPILEIDEINIPDERLKMLFVCAHPKVDASVRTPLMLQTILGLDAAMIAQSFLVPPAAMAQRLVRAKAKIRVSGLRFELPRPSELPERLDAVLESIYAAYGTGWDGPLGSEDRRSGLTSVAIWLGRMLIALMPDEPEPLGLLALMLYCESRTSARRDEVGFVPLDKQPTECWDHSMIAEAEALLARAASFGQLGRCQLEAAIQSVHAARARTKRTDWAAVVGLYRGLLAIAPSTGAAIAHAAALAEVETPRAGLDQLDKLDPATIRAHQPYWATRGELLLRAGSSTDARECITRAAGLAADPAVRAFLLAKIGS